FVLRLDPSNFDALRGIGFCHLENGQLSEARTSLERASLIKPDDDAVREALRFVADRIDEEEEAAAAAYNPGAHEPTAAQTEAVSAAASARSCTTGSSSAKAPCRRAVASSCSRDRPRSA